MEMGGSQPLADSEATLPGGGGGGRKRRERGGDHHAKGAGGGGGGGSEGPAVYDSEGDDEEVRGEVQPVAAVVCLPLPKRHLACGPAVAHSCSVPPASAPSCMWCAGAAQGAAAILLPRPGTRHHQACQPAAARPAARWRRRRRRAVPPQLWAVRRQRGGRQRWAPGPQAPTPRWQPPPPWFWLRQVQVRGACARTSGHCAEQ